MHRVNCKTAFVQKYMKTNCMPPNISKKCLFNLNKINKMGLHSTQTFTKCFVFQIKPTYTPSKL